MAHKRHKTKYFSILIVPDNQKEPRTIKMKYTTLRVLITALVTVIVLVIVGAATYWKVADVALDYVRLEEENFKLRKGLDQMEQLKGDLLQMQHFEKKLRGSLDGYLKVDQLSEDDSSSLQDLNFNRMNLEQRRTIFNSIPSLLPVSGFMTRGYDLNPLLNQPHVGIDIAAPKETPVRATADGIVVFTGWTDHMGYVVILQHDYGFSSLYGHNERNLVDVMQRIRKGDVIALLGDTGRISSGPHLHFEIWKNGRPVDPAYYVGENSKDRS